MSFVCERFVQDRLPVLFKLDTNRVVRLTPGASADILQVQVGSAESAILELADLSGEIVLCVNREQAALVVGSTRGGHVYAVDLNSCLVTCEIGLKRDSGASERSFALHLTPNGQRVVVVEELAITVLTWTGEVLMVHPLTSTVTFEAIEDGAIRLYDQALEADVAYKIPS